MRNLTKEKREKLLSFLDKLKNKQEEESSVVALNEIENFLIGKKYGLLWEEHSERVDEELKTKIPIFKEIKSKEILKDATKKFNFILEGDNLHSLYLLNKTHYNKVDIIYIDPPYNTGNKDFIYNDQYVVKEDGFKHSKWLSFMEKRLKIARELLTKEGIIFISIDDYEYAPLKMLCDEIFGEKNFVSSMIWQRKTGASDSNGIATITEYILVYAKSSDKDLWKETFSKNFESFNEKRYRKTDEYEKARGPYYPDNLDRGGLSYSDSMNYGIECPDGTVTYPNGRVEYLNDGWTWKWGKEKVEWGIQNGFIEFEKSENKESGWSVRYKNYLYVNNEGIRIERAAPFKNLVLGILNGEGTSEIDAVVGKKKFNNPKPLRLIKHLISLVNKKDAVVLDFFAGSGTTGQAILELNQSDSGTRKFILATNNENNICEEVTYKRIKNTLSGYSFDTKKEFLLYEKKINQRDLKNMEKIFKEVEDVKKDESENYNEFKTYFRKGVFELYGILEKNIKRNPINDNLKYYKTDYISRYGDKEYYISNELMHHIIEMIQLEYGVNLDQKEYVFLKDDEDKEKYISDEDSWNQCKKLFKPSYIFLTTKELKKIESMNIQVITIPDYYFLKELREAGEL